MLTGKEIKSYQLFNGLNENELNDIAGLCSRLHYDTNAVIFSPDAPSDNLFLLEGGNDSVQIEIPLGIHDDKIVVHTLSKGEAFGWAALGSQHVKTATARCLDPVSVIAINGKRLMAFLENDNHAGYVVMKNLADTISNRLSYTTVAFRHELRRLRKTVLV